MEMLTDNDLFTYSASRQMHPNSIRALKEEGGKLNAREALILSALKTYGPSTDRELVGLLRFTDCNSVRPRVTSLTQKGLVREAGKVHCRLTNKLVRLNEAVK